MLIATRPRFDMLTGRPARFSGKYTVQEAINHSTEYMGKVDLFEDYFTTWFVERVEQIGKTQLNTLVVLPIVFSMCEIIGQFETGKSGSKNVATNMKRTLAALYQSIEARSGKPGHAEKIAEYLYNNLRNGLVHDGSARKGVYVFTGDIIEFTSQEDSNGNFIQVTVNTMDLFYKLRKHFHSYIDMLRMSEGTGKATLFEKKFNEIFSYLKKG